MPKPGDAKPVFRETFDGERKTPDESQPMIPPTPEEGLREALEGLVEAVCEYVGDDQTAAAEFYKALARARTALGDGGRDE